MSVINNAFLPNCPRPLLKQILFHPNCPLATKRQEAHRHQPLDSTHSRPGNLERKRSFDDPGAEPSHARLDVALGSFRGANPVMVIMVPTCFLNEHELFPRGFTQYTPVVSTMYIAIDVILYHRTHPHFLSVLNPKVISYHWLMPGFFCTLELTGQLVWPDYSECPGPTGMD